MYSQKIMSALWSALVFLRILPSSRSTWTNKLGLLFWMFLITASYATMIYFVNPLSESSPSMMFSILCAYVLWPLEGFIALYQIHKIENNPTPWELFPKRMCHFLLCKSLHLTDMIYTIWLMIYDEMEWWFKVAFFLGSIVVILVTFGADLTVGCFARQFCKEIKDSFGVEALENVNVFYPPLISKYKLAKENLECLLLVAFFLESLMLTSLAFIFVRYPAKVITLIYCLYWSAHLSYIAFVLEDCFNALKSTLPRLRLTTSKKNVYLLDFDTKPNVFC